MFGQSGKQLEKLPGKQEEKLVRLSQMVVTFQGTFLSSKRVGINKN